MGVLVGITVVFLVAVWLSTWLGHDLLRPEAACQDRLPWFEGIEVEQARVSLHPPLIRCKGRDTDLGQEDDYVVYHGWGTEPLLATVVVDGLAVALVALAFKRRGTK